MHIMNEQFNRLCPTNQQGAVCLFPPHHEGPVNLVDAARKRPGMYVGHHDANGVHYMLCDVLDMLIFLSTEQDKLKISVEISTDWVAFRSNQMDMEKNMTCWDNLAIPVAAALSQRFQLFLSAPGQRICHSYEKGIYTKSSSHPPLENQLIELRLWPDPEIFTDLSIDYFGLFDRSFTLAALYPGISISLHGFDEQQNQLCFPEGMFRLLAGFGSNTMLSAREKTLKFECEADEILVRGVIRKCAFPEKHLSYVNGNPTPDDGSHVEGLCRGIARALDQTDVAGSEEEKPEDYVRKHYEFAVALWMEDPIFADSVKRQLENMEIVQVVEEIVFHAMSEADL